MGCEVLADRQGKPACGIKGLKSEHAITRRAVSITDACDIDVGKKVVLTYANGNRKHLMVKVSIESENGEDFCCWAVNNVRSAHNPKPGKRRHYGRLRSFLELAERAGIAPVVLANYILLKSP